MGPEQAAFADCCTECGALQPRLSDLRMSNERLAIENAQKASTISRLRGERNGKPGADPYAIEAHQVYDYWRARLCPRAREFNGTPQAKILARLRAGHTVDELKLAIDGVATDQWHRKVNKVELEYIFRDEDHVQKFIALAPQETPQGPQTLDLRQWTAEQRQALREALRARVDALAATDRLERWQSIIGEIQMLSTGAL